MEKRVAPEQYSIMADIDLLAVVKASQRISGEIFLPNLEEALRQSENLRRAIFESEPACVKLVAPDGTLLAMNPAGLAMVGAGRLDQVVGQSVLPLIAPEWRAMWQELNGRVCQGETVVAEFEIVGIAGTRRWMETHAAPFRDKHGKIIAHLAITHDITERKRAEALRTGQSRVLEMIATNAPLQDVLGSLMRLIESQSAGMLGSILLLDEDGKHLRHGAAPSLPEAYTKAIDGAPIGPRVGSCGTAMYRGEPVMVTDILQDSLWADYRDLAAPYGLRACWSTPILSHQGKVLGSFAMYYREVRSPSLAETELIDIATHLAGIAIERKRVEEELRRHREHLEELVSERTAELAVARDQAEEADRLKSAFLATMSHELRTPLNSILGFTGILLQGLAGPLNAEQTKQLQMVQSSGRHLLHLINEVLDLSKIEAGQMEIRLESFDMRQVIAKTARTLAPLAAGKQLPLLTDVAPEVDQVSSDPRRVEQILLNLVHNAIKFTATGQVRIACWVSGGQLLTSVADTGIGIKPEDLDKLFMPFRQLDSTLARQHEGSGLGLVICKRLADLLGGEIWVESQWERGSTFTFVLPRHV